MELLLLILAGALVALWASNRSLKQRLDWLEQRLDAFAPLAPAPLMEQPEPAPSPPPLEPEPSPSPVEQEASPPPPEPEERESIGGLFERLVAGRLLIWIGGAALATAALLLVRYSIEIGLVTPAMRMIAAAIFGLALLGAGEYARAGRFFSDDPRFAQALVGAGLVALYATPYGSLVLYGLIGTATAGAAMAAVAGTALLMSLRHGAPTAIMGLVGGFLTPLLVGTGETGAVPLLAYLALLNLALFAVAWRRGWSWLAAAAVALSYVWTLTLLFRPAGDALAAGLFVLVLALVASVARPGGDRAARWIQPLAIGLVQLALLVGRADLGAPAWGLFGALAASALVLAALREEQRAAPAIALALALILLLVEAAPAEAPLLPHAAAGATLLFGLGGLALRLVQDRRSWTAIACGGFAGPLLVLRLVRPEGLEPAAWGALAAALALGTALAIWLERRRAAAEPPASPVLLAAGAAAALLLGAAVWDLLPRDLAAAGWLAVALVLALAARRLEDLALSTIAVIAAMVAVARALWMVPELSTAPMMTLIGFPVLAPDLPGAREALYALALPALLLALLRLALPPVPLGARRVLPAVAGLFAAAALYVWFKQAFGLADEADFAARGLIERTLLTQALFVAGWLLGAGLVRLPRLDEEAARLAGTVLTALAAVRLIWLDLLVFNPLVEAQWVGALPVANLILPQYLLGAFWLYLARRRADRATRSGFWLGAFLAALVMGTLLLVRQGFQGAFLTGPDLPTAEFYAYSLAVLILSIGLIVAGVRLPDKALRLAGLVLLTATVLKVFLVDASELEGIWRILSFLGLGVALIGIARLYGPVLRAGASPGTS